MTNRSDLNNGSTKTMLRKILKHLKDKEKCEPWGSDRETCNHNWQPVSMVFEVSDHTKDVHGSVRIPDPEEGRVYLVCLKCASHTYMSTKFEYRLHGSEDQNIYGEWVDPDDPPTGYYGLKLQEILNTIASTINTPEEFREQTLGEKDEG